MYQHCNDIYDITVQEQMNKSNNNNSCRSFDDVNVTLDNPHTECRPSVEELSEMFENMVYKTKKEEPYHHTNGSSSNDQRHTSILKIHQSGSNDKILISKVIEKDKKAKYKSVSFSNINIREYDVTIGDNPSVSYGVPLSLDWTYTENYCSSIDDYEHVRKDTRERNINKVKLNYFERKFRLIHGFGFTEEDVADGARQVLETQRQRLVSSSICQDLEDEEAAAESEESGDDDDLEREAKVPLLIRRNQHQDNLLSLLQQECNQDKHQVIKKYRQYGSIANRKSSNRDLVLVNVFPMIEEVEEEQNDNEYFKGDINGNSNSRLLRKDYNNRILAFSPEAA